MKHLKLIVVGICILGIISPSFAGEQLWNFDDGSADDWKVANGNWSVTDGVYKLELGAQAEHSLVGDVDWTDYTIEARVRVDEGNWAGIAFRAKSEMEYYVFYFNVPDNKTELWRHKTGGWTARDNLGQLPGENVTIERGKWHDVKVIVQGDSLGLEIDGEAQGAIEDGLYPQGQIGVWGWQTAASFDDIKVSGTEIEGEITPVEPLDKLTTTWARVKSKR